MPDLARLFDRGLEQALLHNAAAGPITFTKRDGDQKAMTTTAKSRKKKGLGRGLSALIPESSLQLDASTESSQEFFRCDIHRISPNRYQPRHTFSDEELSELADSIREQGIIQPLVVRAAESGAYELVAGERRLRAARLAELETVPVVVREVSDAKLLELAIVENIQRENLNPIEEADAYHRLMELFSLTQEEMAAKVGKSRPAVANFLRLRQLPPEIKACIRDGRLSMGHARALLGTDNPLTQKEAFRTVLEKALSVRQTEELVRRLKADSKTHEKEPEVPSAYQLQLDTIAERLSHRFGNRVQISKRGKKGRLEIEFYGDEDFNRLLTLLEPA
ncbi:ParB/RepB/Spo0J family partition protein [Desulfoluna spongiiphila]|uniref:Chromosome partitioning protein, ParB family n=1 Tax=Desulfoluna spongiiphila TaxID=419481 RepID=A0A1G5GHR4_9BACT|nr:ParB/RepB/Spo0J family partition protein [Desulfoluna spongiiphila]SCY51075.1 chromosome partitioning protein, ParB family [Desulfoluna spongiiphila]